MPHHKSAAKRVITNARDRVRNIALRTRMRSAVKAVRTAATRSEAMAAYRSAMSVLDRTASAGVIKKETASRHKARLARHAQKLPA
ncbi:MAG: 30S ribosomal protein S20 [Candidatus Eisenbacteria bacterium]|uniref:Small ribosomal subunit protein bS20 n=1 Tax=Eiseniibacteriota bacterium TaxID=2212470 RepID=A0A538S970_UNCEI|nr:MAG: 30S ribosomal protein S20 [Candidatus Eisenbacteria bacterium]